MLYYVRAIVRCTSTREEEDEAVVTDTTMMNESKRRRTWRNKGGVAIEGNSRDR